MAGMTGGHLEPGSGPSPSRPGDGSGTFAVPPGHSHWSIGSWSSGSPRGFGAGRTPFAGPLHGSRFDGDAQPHRGHRARICIRGVCGDGSCSSGLTFTGEGQALGTSERPWARGRRSFPPAGAHTSSVPRERPLDEVGRGCGSTAGRTAKLEKAERPAGHRRRSAGLWGGAKGGPGPTQGFLQRLPSASGSLDRGCYCANLASRSPNARWPAATSLSTAMWTGTLARAWRACSAAACDPVGSSRVSPWPTL